MTRAVVRTVLCALLAIAASITPALAQGTTASLSGVVTDTAGGVVPGATVVVKNNATNVAVDTVTNSSGAFSIAAMDAGTYTVTVSLQGFKTAVVTDVRIVTGVAASVSPKLEIGALSETVEVKGGAELIQTSSTSVTSTISVEQLTKLPLSSRNALYAVALLPGVSTVGGPRTAGINGLPNNTVNVTIDGVSTGNMLQSTDGFFSMVTPRMDAVEEITVTGAVPGAGSGAGSVQIQMTTRSGSNRFDGSLYHYWRQPDFNSNYYFNRINNLPKNEVTVHQYGFRQGGPIVIPGLFDGRGKAFFFFNFEHLHQPSSATRTRALLRPEAQNGIFGWVSTVAGVQVRNQVDILALAAANGQIATKDPLVQQILAEIRAAAGTTGVINDLNAGNTLEYVYQSESTQNQYSPTTRLDFNLSDRHRLSGAYWLQRFKNPIDLLNGADARFPGLPNFGSQNSYRTTGNSTLRSTFGSNVVNELKGGFQWSPNNFFTNVTADQFANQDGMAIGFPIGTSATTLTQPGPRNTTTWSVDNAVNWLRGAHSISFGGGYAGIYNWINNYNVVPTMTLGFDQNLDPARGMFTSTATGNFPGATAAQLNEARALYALLTGRVLSIPGTARLNDAGEYVYNGGLKRASRQTSFSAFIQDSWRVTPALTVNGGIRWDLHMPFTPADSTWSLATMEDICGVSGLGTGPGGRACNIFNPSASGGQLVPTFDRFEPGHPAHNTNWTDFAPNIGVAWRPDVQDGFLRTLLGDPDQATLRAGYAMSFNQERIDRFTVNAGSNAGGAIGATRDNGANYPLVLPGESHPVLLSERSRLGAPAFPATVVYPMAAAQGDSINIFPEDIKTPRVHSYSVGIQRSLGRDMALEVRYVGNKNMNTWAEENWNEQNFIENGFLDEFKKAQANLFANIAAGRGNTFAFTGVPGTSPLPIHLAYLNGSADSANPAAYTSTNFAAAAFTNRLSPLRPQVANAMNALHGTGALRTNALNAGLPANFVVMNPRALGGTFVVQDKNWTKYDSLQVELRRRLAQGLLVSANYTYGIKEVSLLQTLRQDRISVDASDDRNSPHVFKMNWTYEVPVGRGRRFGADLHPVLNGIFGDWEFAGNGRVQADRFRMAGVKLNGMTQDELQEAFKVRIVKDPVTNQTRVYSFPQDIIDNTWAAFAVDPTTPTGYSVARGVPTGRYISPASDATCIQIYRYDCGAQDINLNGPLFSRWDMRLTKRFPISGRLNVEFTAEVLNVFDNINFNHSVNFAPANGEDTFRVTTAFTDINTTFDPGGRIGQLVWRINW